MSLLRAPLWGPPDERAMRFSRNLLPWLTFLVVATALGLSAYAHVSSQEFAASRSYRAFAQDVAPILSASCSARDDKGNYVCHGRPAGRMGEELEEVGGTSAKLPHMVPPTASGCDLCHAGTGQMRFTFPVAASGKIETDRQRLLAFDKARTVAAKLLRMPLGAQAGGMGLYHPGGEIFETSADPDYQKLVSWVALDKAQSGKVAPVPSKAEQFFGKEVLPILARRTCLSPACHTFNHSSFIPDPGTPGQDMGASLASRFNAEQISYNRATAKGLIQSLVYLTGDVEQSRFLKKIIPIEAGGILHRGGNDQFLRGPEDPDYQTIKQWLTLERDEAAAKLRIDSKPVLASNLGRLQGIVFVRTPAENTRKYLDVGAYLPGGDLFLLKLKPGETPETASSQPVNLTAQFHIGTLADIREPDVRYDARAIVFAMRKGEQDQLNLYEILLDDKLDVRPETFRRLTYGPATVNGMAVHYTDPTYVADPTDDGAGEGGVNLERVDLVFAANLSGRVVPSTEREIIGQADDGDASHLVDFDRSEPDNSFVGQRIYVVSGTNEGQWRTITGFVNHLAIHKADSPQAPAPDFGDKQASVLTVDTPFEKAVDHTTVYAIEKAAASLPGLLPGYSVYGMKVAPRGQEQTYYDQTLTRMTYNLGQELDLSVRSTGEVFFGSQRSAVDKYGRPVFHMASCRRHFDTRFSFPTHQGNRSHVPIYADNVELPTGIDIHIGMDADNLWEGGNLIVSDHQFGPDMEAKNPNLFTSGVFDEQGVPRTVATDISNTRFQFQEKAPAHPRFVFKTIALFPTRGGDAITWTGVSPGGLYRDPMPLPDGRLLVSFAPGPINQFDAKAKPDFDLYVMRGAPTLHPVGGKGVPNIDKVRVAAASAPGYADVQAMGVYVRMKPKVNAGKRPKSEHIIRYPGTPPDTRPATFVEKNYLLIDAIMRDPSPTGKRVAYAQDPVTGETLGSMDQIAAVRFVEALPLMPDVAGPLDLQAIANHDPQSTLISNGISPMKRVVGEAPVYKDGSVYCKVPSYTPMLIQSVNADGMALRQEARYYFFAPNEPFGVSPGASETFRTCGACMGSVTGKPEDLFGPMLPYAGTVAGGVEAIARNKAGPPPLGLAVEQRKTVDFIKDIQPILEQHCTTCHAGATAAAHLDLSGTPTRYYNVAYESLMQLQDPQSGWYGRKKFISERDALAIESYLTAKLWGKQLKAKLPLQGDAPHPSPALFQAFGKTPAPLSDAERRTLALWIDLGAAFRGSPPVAAAGGGR